MKKEMALRLYPQVIRHSGREIQWVLVVTPAKCKGWLLSFLNYRETGCDTDLPAGSFQEGSFVPGLLAVLGL